MIKIDRERLFDLLNGDDDEFVHVYDEVLSSKHSATFNFAVFRKDSKFFGVEYWHDYNNGIEDDSFELFPVEAVQTVTYRKISAT